MNQIQTNVERRIYFAYTDGISNALIKEQRPIIHTINLISKAGIITNYCKALIAVPIFKI